jgi:chromate transporter
MSQLPPPPNPLPQGEGGVTLKELFLGFSQIALSGFGGVLPFARRVIVEQRAWISSEEFTSLLGLCQFLPGPNVVNLSICIGARFHGAAGAVTAFSGILLPPFFIVIALGALYQQYGDIPAVNAMLKGVSAVAAGLIVSTGLKMALDIRRRPLLLLFTLLTIAGIALLRWPLVFVMIGLAPFSILLAARCYGGGR